MHEHSRAVARYVDLRTGAAGIDGKSLTHDETPLGVEHAHRIVTREYSQAAADYAAEVSGDRGPRPPRD